MEEVKEEIAIVLHGDGKVFVVPYGEGAAKAWQIRATRNHFSDALRAMGRRRS